MKICLVTETFPPEINGVSMTLGRLVEGLSRRGVETTVVAPRRADRRDLVGSSGAPLAVKIMGVPGLPIPRYPELRFGLPAARTLRRTWRADRPDIVHVATEGPLGWSALRVCRQMAIPCVSSFHTNFHSYGSHYGFGWFKSAVLGWLRYCHNRTELTFAPSADLIEQLAGQGFRNLRLFSRGVDTQLFGPHRRCAQLRSEWGVDATTPVAVYVGRLAGEKNLDLVVRAHARMRERLPDLRLVLVGDGPDRERIRKACPGAHFAGMRTGEDLARHYASADCFIFASTTETFGNVVTEAMASCLAVLAYDYAAPARFIRNGENGFLAGFANEQDFLQQAEKLAAVRDEWTGVGEAARQTILPHSWDAIIEDYLGHLNGIHPQQAASAATLSKPAHSHSA